MSKCMKSSSQHTEVRVIPSFPENLLFRDIAPRLIYNFILSNAHWTVSHSPRVPERSFSTGPTPLNSATRFAVLVSGDTPRLFGCHTTQPHSQSDCSGRLLLVFKSRSHLAAAARDGTAVSPASVLTCVGKWGRFSDLWHRLSYCHAFLYAPNCAILSFKAQQPIFNYKPTWPLHPTSRSLFSPETCLVSFPPLTHVLVLQMAFSTYYLNTVFQEIGKFHLSLILCTALKATILVKPIPSCNHFLSPFPALTIFPLVSQPNLDMLLKKNQAVRLFTQSFSV